jgi:D-inositol-3-phosphate glycosyltransferase
VKILVVSQMWPSPEAPDLGIFVARLCEELERQGHELDRAVIDRRGLPKTKYARLGWRAARRVRAFRPDVVYAHFLAPTGALGALAARAARRPLVVTAHGTDVANIGRIAGIRAATRFATSRASAVIAVSDYLRRTLASELPELEGRIEVIDCGVDLDRFRGGDAAAARERLGWRGEPPFYLFVGSLEPRKNVVSLVQAFERLGHGSLAIVGDGPLRPEVEGSERVLVVGRVRHDQVADWITACDVLCQPSLVEPFGQALVEAMACERPVLATEVGGPPEFVTPGTGVLVDPESIDSIEAGLREAAKLPVPNPDARKAAARHDVRLQASRVAAVLERAATPPS